MKPIVLVAAVCLLAPCTAAQDVVTSVNAREEPVEQVGACMCELEPRRRALQTMSNLNSPSQFTQLFKFKLRSRTVFNFLKSAYRFPSNSRKLIDSLNVTDVLGLQVGAKQGANGQQEGTLQTRFRQLEAAFSQIFDSLADDEIDYVDNLVTWDDDTDDRVDPNDDDDADTDEGANEEVTSAELDAWIE